MRRHLPWIALGLLILAMLVVQFVPDDGDGGGGASPSPAVDDAAPGADTP